MVSRLEHAKTDVLPTIIKAREKSFLLRMVYTGKVLVVDGEKLLEGDSFLPIVSPEIRPFLAKILDNNPVGQWFLQEDNVVDGLILASIQLSARQGQYGDRLTVVTNHNHKPT